MPPRVKVFVKQLDTIAMPLAEFQDHYSNLSRSQIAKIAGCSTTTVNNWFATGECHREPTEGHQLRLGLYHWINTAPPALTEIFTIALNP